MNNIIATPPLIGKLKKCANLEIFSSPWAVKRWFLQGTGLYKVKPFNGVTPMFGNTMEMATYCAPCKCELQPRQEMNCNTNISADFKNTNIK